MGERGGGGSENKEIVGDTKNRESEHERQILLTRIKFHKNPLKHKGC